jgi:hypothetical protein
MQRKSDIVRTSRAGDQFHYRWAARRCLGLLDPISGLVCITIEGIASDESLISNNASGEEVVDIAEYYGSSKIENASKISYHQLKHSYEQTKPFTLSALKKTLAGFFKRFMAIKDATNETGSLCAEFTFTTNRSVTSEIHQLFDRIRSGTITQTDTKSWATIKNHLGTDNEIFAKEFIGNFRLHDSNDVHWKQRNILISELESYIVGSDSEAADQLWRLVTDKALPEHANSPEIRREDVLRYLGTDEDKLFPAPCLIEDGCTYFAREQEEEILQEILGQTAGPIILHAEGGVGKTALARRLYDRISNHGVAILYDCFGNGGYRNLTLRRDEHRVGLVQIANELAATRLCLPLIPSNRATPADYLRDFEFRLRQSVAVLKAKDPTAKLVIIVDAADNAEMAAEEYHERSSFAKDLIRHPVPEGVVLVFVCRTHRIGKLSPPVGYSSLSLEPFIIEETNKLLIANFPNATIDDGLEFHRLSSKNPRVQATALARGLTLYETLLLLGPNPTTVEDSIKAIFEQSISKLIDTAGPTEATQIRKLCEALATLRPFVPIEILALASGIEASAIRTFVLELGRPLSLVGNAVQFFDEPSETWFRETYKPKSEALSGFIDALQSLALTSSYVATALPQLMLEAGQYAKLVALVLADKDLPTANPVERRVASLQRLQFALKAALRSKSYEDAAKLALKAGGR